MVPLAHARSYERKRVDAGLATQASLTGSRLLFVLVLLSAMKADAALASGNSTVDFNRDIRPIFNQSCTSCHGGVKAESGVSLVFKLAPMHAGKSGRPTIVPGKPEQSELFARINSTDEDFRMPLAEHAQRLADGQIALIRRWIEEGATWSEHWAFVPPRPQAFPTVKTANWARSGLDRFVLAKLEREALQPSPHAGKAELLRRVSLDLTGLPPSLDEQAAFFSDASPEAYERVVDRLLASPRFGERWAAVWLDIARYADTKGYEDRERSMWKYRDWVIDALNRNLPYDRFVIEQLAGDLLPNPSLEQLIATAFHRNTLTNDEGGTDDEEFRLAAVQDRIATTWTALNATTFGCVQCHSHPYDPIRHEEYYRFLAFFNSTRDADLPSDYPALRVPDDTARYEEAGRLQSELMAILRDLTGSGRTLAAQTNWRAWAIDEARGSTPLAVELRDGEAFVSGTIPMGIQYDLIAAAPAGSLSAFRIEVPPLQPDIARHTPELGFHVTRIEARIITPDGREEPFELKRFFRDSDDYPAAPERAAPPRPKNEPAVTNPPRLAVLAGTNSAFQSDPSLFTTRWIVCVPREPVNLPAGSRLKVQLTHSLPRITKIDPIRRVRLSFSGDARWTALAADERLQKLDARLEQLAEAIPAIPGTYLPIVRDLPASHARETRLFSRGNWMIKAGPPLEADVPGLFPALPSEAPRNRLTVAQWFFSPGQPLTARVAVNRAWEQLFGLGLVETLEDFGSVGEPASHPELLDWLALRFQNELRWDKKALLRDLVLSATYRQTAGASAILRARDPKNRWLARGPRNRLSAEMLRDQMLFAAGLLSEKMHGPPVMPPQPDEMGASIIYGTWKDSTGEDRFRRAIYTFWRRSDPYPSFVTFDAPSREKCSVRRLTTNTPLQALVTLNDPVYQEAGRALAGRMQKTHTDLPEQLGAGFRAAASRAPEKTELAALIRLHDDALTMFQTDPAASAKLGATDAADAARIAAAQAILNLDTVLSK